MVCSNKLQLLAKKKKKRLGKGEYPGNAERWCGVSWEYHGKEKGGGVGEEAGWSLEGQAKEFGFILGAMRMIKGFL